MEEFRTKTGRVLTDADFEALADEAERGYDVDTILRVREQMEAKLQEALNDAGRSLDEVAEGLQKLAKVTGSVLVTAALTHVEKALQDLQGVSDESQSQAGD